MPNEPYKHFIWAQYAASFEVSLTPNLRMAEGGHVCRALFTIWSNTKVDSSFVLRFTLRGALTRAKSTRVLTVTLTLVLTLTPCVQCALAEFKSSPGGANFSQNCFGAQLKITQTETF